jgi:protein-S-isoprenylcysteine O-methyltransferase Ste14
MDLYSQHSKSIPQKLTIIAIELLLLGFSYWILFRGGGDTLLGKPEVQTLSGNQYSRGIIFAFSVIVFLRINFTLFFLLKRKIPWEESISIPFAFALYYIGYALLAYGRTSPIDWLDFLAIFIFLTGSFLITFSELQRHFWKQRPENKGKLFTRGLFGYAMHINYFGDLLWVMAYAMVTRSLWSVTIPLFLFCFFVFYNIPTLDAHLGQRYPKQFADYRKRTKRLIPFIY